MKAVRVVVTGRVQGVGFRHYVWREASRRGIAGRVWNRPDGAVELTAQTDDDGVLSEFVDSMRSGPARVDRVVVEPGSPDPAAMSFVIRRHR